MGCLKSFFSLQNELVEASGSGTPGAVDPTTHHPGWPRSLQINTKSPTSREPGRGQPVAPRHVPTQSQLLQSRPNYEAFCYPWDWQIYVGVISGVNVGQSSIYSECHGELFCDPCHRLSEPLRKAAVTSSAVASRSGPP